MHGAVWHADGSAHAAAAASAHPKSPGMEPSRCAGGGLPGNQTFRSVAAATVTFLATCRGHAPVHLGPLNMATSAVKAPARPCRYYPLPGFAGAESASYQCITTHCATRASAVRGLQEVVLIGDERSARKLFEYCTCTRAVRGALPLNALGREAVAPWAPSSGVMASAFAILATVPGLKQCQNAVLEKEVPQTPALSLCMGSINYSTMRLQIWQGSGGPRKRCRLRHQSAADRGASLLQWLPLC